MIYMIYDMIWYDMIYDRNDIWYLIYNNIWHDIWYGLMHASCATRESELNIVPAILFSTTDFSPVLSRCFLLLRRFLIDFESMLLPFAAIFDWILHFDWFMIVFWVKIVCLGRFPPIWFMIRYYMFSYDMVYGMIMH